MILFSDGRSSVTTPIEDCTSLYAFMPRLNLQKLFHLGSANHMRCDAENDEFAESYEVPFWSLVIAATCKARCECATRTLLFFPGVEQRPHVQTKLDNLLVLQSLFKYRKFLCFSESLKQSCLNFPLSGFYTGATVNLTPR